MHFQNVFKMHFNHKMNFKGKDNFFFWKFLCVKLFLLAIALITPFKKKIFFLQKYTVLNWAKLFLPDSSIAYLH